MREEEEERFVKRVRYELNEYYDCYDCCYCCYYYGRRELFCGVFVEVVC